MENLLSGFRGGVHPPTHKNLTRDLPISALPAPPQWIIPLHQHIGKDATLLVKTGEYVRKGQKLAAANGYISAAVHAPASGKVYAIEKRPVPHPSGLSAMCVVLDNDGKECPVEHEPNPEYHAIDPSALRNLIREAGIVGLGGAGFPSHVKLNPLAERKIDLLILNGAECEPYITCDDRLMRERAESIIAGAQIMCHALQVQQCIVAIEDDKPEAIAAMQQASRHDASITIAAISTCYPNGSEKQLILNLTGREVPRNGLPADIGAVMHNVATAFAVFRAVVHGEPLISRVVTVTGLGVQHPGNYEVGVGTPLDYLLQHCGYVQSDAPMVMGGSMMGIRVLHPQAPVIKTTNCIIAAGRTELTYDTRYHACIRCGACVQVCPAYLQPQHLYWYARGRNFEQSQAYGLFDCIECGCCAYVCPSRIPLVQFYRYAKSEIWTLELEREKSDRARVRFEQRSARLQRDKDEREERLKQRRQSLQQNASTPDAQDPIAAAIARAEQKKKSQNDGGPDA